MAKSSRFQYKYRKSASKLHKAAGEILRSHPLLKHYTSYQEYPVNRINPDFKNGKCKYDWVIIELRVIVEIMGEQHAKWIPFFHKTEADFVAQQERDEEKKQAALEAGYTYIAVAHNETLDVDLLVDLAIKNSAPITPRKKKSFGMSDSQKEFQREIKEKQKTREKEYRKKLKHDRKSSS